MQRTPTITPGRTLIATGILLVPTAGLALADLPRPLNFANETSGRIILNQTEGSSNEKEVEFGDLDNDGDPDIVMAVGSSDFGERKNKLFLNVGGVFQEMSGAPLIPEFAQQDVSRNAFIRDFTGDGVADIYIINDSNSGGFAGTDKIYVGIMDGETLTGYSQENGSRIPSGGALGAACGGIAHDLDGDGDQDVYSGNYPGPSQDRGLYNGGTGIFSDVTSTMIPSDGDYTVDVSIADMNGDGKIDLLVSNDFDPNFVYYNDNNGAGSGLGDFRYTGSTQNVGTAGAGENAMEAADLDNDGDNDIVWTNMVGSSGDRILENTGNDGANKATFATRNVLPPLATSMVSRKTTIADLNEDGRKDLVIASQSGGRLIVARNTTVSGATMSFVDWTPATAVPSASMRGWHAAVFDTNADGDLDIVVGAFNGDHLLESVGANEHDEDDLGPGANLPALWNTDPVAIYGRGDASDVDAYIASDIASGFVSVVVNGPDDYLLEVVNGGGSVIATSDRGGLGVEEALQASTTSGSHTIRVTILADGGGACGPPDFDGDCNVGFADLLTVLGEWGCTDCPQDLDGDGVAGFTDLLMLLAAWGPVEGADSDYLLEVLGRS